MRRSNAQRWACALAAAWTTAAAAQPQPDPPLFRPEAARRVVRQFSFDEPEKFALPQYWSLAQDGFAAAGGTDRPGFPVFNGAEHDPVTGSAGPGSVRLWTRGGSTSLRLDPGVIPVFPGTEYLVSARIQTRSLRHARAALVARYLDKANQPIPASESRSARLATGPGEWLTITATLSGDFADAAYIQIDLELLQPEQFRPAELGSHQVWPQDFTGDAWFDDVAVVQLPKVDIATDSPVNIIVGPDAPSVRVAVRDLAGETLTARLSLTDATGRIIDTQERPLPSGRESWSWTPKADRYGWYRAILELSTQSRRVGGTYVDLAWLPPRSTAGDAGADRARFGLIAADLPPKHRMLLAEIARASGAGTVTIPVWPRDLTADAVPRFAQDLTGLMAALRPRGRQVAFALTAVPDALAGDLHVEPDRPFTAFAADPKGWSPYLLPLIDKFGQSVQRWQIGAVGQSGAASPRAEVSLRNAHEYLAQLVPGPVVAVPWPGELAGAPAGPYAAVMLMPHAIAPEGIADLAASWRERGWPRSLTVVPEPFEDGPYSRADAAAALAKRIVEWWRVLNTSSESGPMLEGSIALLQPWSWPEHGRERAMPHAELAVFANLIDRLDGRRIAGALPMGKGVTCYILAPIDPGRGGALVAWAGPGAGADAAIEAYLGAGPVQCVDLWGNASPVPTLDPAPREGASTSRARRALSHRIPLSGEPVFIENVDVDLVRFVASFRIDPPFAESTGAEHELSAVLTNPFRVRAEGRLNILEPGGLSEDIAERDRTWHIAPRVSTFSIPPGESVRIPITAAFSAVEEVGPKAFIGEVEFTVDRDYGPLRVRTTFEVRMESMDLDVAYRCTPTPTGPDVIVEVQATNHGKAAATLELSAFAPGYPRAKAAVADLEPGATALRRFVFPRGAERLKGQRIAVGAQNVDSQARINRSIVIE